MIKLPIFFVTGLLFFLSTLLFALDEKTNASLTFPLRGAFYYPWYPQTWTVGGVHVKYDVELGYYSSDDPDVVDQHIQDMDYAKIDVAIISWWGINKQNQANRVPMLLDQTIDAGSRLKWAIYYEKEGFGNPTVDELQADLDYLMETYAGHEAFAHIDGKPVIFVYNADDGDCSVAERWAEATNGEWYVNLKVFGGFRQCDPQPDSWHQYGPASSAQQHHGYSYVISPGFWRADEADPRLERDIDRWNKDIRAMIASKEPWQLITTFNEWGEGTAIERCWDWASDTDYGLYLDALHNDGKPGDSTAIEGVENRPVNFDLAQNYPNPFNPTTIINFSIPQTSHVTLTVYNIMGQKIKTLCDKTVSGGDHNVIWDGKDINGVTVANGIYIYKLKSHFGVKLRKMTRLL
ncbi:T9SS type A sorting domain-containing protein [candidate division KSB1 bacterium]|nr:T9SS type A sorting domain-containing protein [candidate division KSB1 bacterium]